MSRLRPLRVGHLAILLTGLLAPPALSAQASYEYQVDVADGTDDRFRVTVTIHDSRPADSIFQFAVTAPGLYQVVDAGRYVRDLRARDAEGLPVAVDRVSTNRWRFAEPERVRTVEYSVAETWDTPVRENPVYLMAGSSLESDHALVNANVVLGFPAGRQNEPLRVRFLYPEGWRAASALVADEQGWYPADDYDHLVDSPFLLGRLSSAAMDVQGVPVEVWVYSRTDRVQARDLLESMEAMLLAAGEFLGRLPVSRYVFLWHFEDVTAGAWEHSYSSEYVFAEPRDWTPAIGRALTDVAAHEFFHVVTPLNIHSEVIEAFDFSNPTPSRHLWLYEGVTEWASDIMQLRAGLIDLPEYLERQRVKILQQERMGYDPDFSLFQLALQSYTEAGQRQYANIYERGALVAGLLDLRLLELSEGRRGLRELVLGLAEVYGKERPFPEEGFLEVVTAMTYPEIGRFLDRYVRRAEPLPVAEYYEKVGVRYAEVGGRFEVIERPTPEQRALRQAWLRPGPVH